MDKITKLNIFDFDGTLARTPLPEFGKPHFEQKTGVKWQHVGWWSKAESLDMDVFDIPLIEETYKACVSECDLDHVYTVMVTGRMNKLSEHVEKILDANLLEFDERHYNVGGSSFDGKIKTFNKLVAKLPNLKIVEMWDDRIDHRAGFLKWGEELECDFKYNLVK